MEHRSPPDGRRAELAARWNEQLHLAQQRADAGDDAPAARAANRGAGVVVFGVGLVLVVAVVLAWRWVGRAPRLLVGLALVLPVLGVALMVTGRNPLRRVGQPIPFATLAMASGTPQPMPQQPPPPQPSSAPPAATPAPMFVDDCPACGRPVGWDGTLYAEAGPGADDEPALALGYRCGCGNTFERLDAATVGALRQAVLDGPLQCRDGVDHSEHRWWAAWGPATLDIGVGDFPAEPLYAVRIGEVELLTVDDWPAGWVRPGAAG